MIVDVNGFYADHHHDDRYHTKDQINAELDSKASIADVYTKTEIDDIAAGMPLPIAYGVVGPDATLLTGDGVESVTWDGGNHVLDLTTPIDPELVSSKPLGVQLTSLVCDEDITTAAAFDLNGPDDVNVLVSMYDVSDDQQVQCPFTFAVYDFG